MTPPPDIRTAADAALGRAIERVNACIETVKNGESRKARVALDRALAEYRKARKATLDLDFP